MKKIKKIKQDFAEGKISKNDLINNLHDFHSILFDYSKNLNDTQIKEIILKDNKVYFELNNHLLFNVDEFDKRTAGIESFNFNTYEPELSDILLKLSSQCEYIFDVGANIGWYSLHFSINKNTKIYSFEPISTIYEQLNSNVRLNKKENINTFNIALSDNQGDVEFFYDPKNATASSEKNILDSDIKPVKCKQISLDLFMKNNEIKKIDLIKCDVEGAEIKVIKGGLNSINLHKPIIFLEMLRKWSAKFGYHPNEIINLLRELDYECYSVGKKISPIKVINESTIPTNFMFLNRVMHKSIIDGI